MRAITHTRFGGPDVLALGEVERPTVGAHDVLVEVHASAVSQGDRRLREADFPGATAIAGRLMFGITKPRYLVPGTAYAGRVVEVGAKVTRFAVGDDVYASVMHGGYAEYTAIAQDGPIAKMPKGLSYAEAATLPYGVVTSLGFLRDLAKVQPGESVLVVGASGGVGRYAVQVATHLGAEVTAVLSRDADLARELGATHVVDYTKQPVTGRYDVVFDMTENGRLSTYREHLTPNGRWLSLYVNGRNLFDMLRTRLFGGPRALCTAVMPDAQMMDDVTALIEAGGARPVIAQRFALASIVDAHRALDERLPGDVVVDVRPAVALRRVA